MSLESNEQIRKEFFNRCADEVARDLIGCCLFRRGENRGVGGQIVETEAYCEIDPAAHCYQGKKGTEKKPMMHDAMYCSAGTIYVYPNSRKEPNDCFLNFVCGGKGFGSGVLIRAIMPTSQDRDLCNGPMKLCHALDISHKLNKMSFDGFLERFELIKPEASPLGEVLVGRRVGVSEAVDWPRSYATADKSAFQFVSPAARRLRSLSDLESFGMLKGCRCAI